MNTKCSRCREGRRAARALAAAIIMAIALISACRRSDKPESEMEEHATKGETNVVTFSPAKIQNGSVAWSRVGTSRVAGSIELPGELVPNEDRTARLGAPAQGRVLTVHVRPGDHVRRGQPLVTLQSQEAGMAQADLTKAQAEVASRRAAATYARAARERAERLVRLKAIPLQDVERAIADDELAQASLAQAEAELRRARQTAVQLGVGPVTGSMVIRASLAGVVLTREAVPGAVVDAGAPLITVSDPATLWLNIAVPERHAPLVREGTRLRFVTASFPADTFAARAQSVAGALDPTTRTLPVRAVVPNPAGRLRPETFATTWIEGGQRDAITVPDSALQRLAEKPVVFVATPDGKGGARLEKREVEIGASGAGQTEIVRGLNVGEQVVVRGAYAVKAEFARGSMPEMEM